MWVVVVAMVMVVMMPILETHPFNNLDFILNAWPSFMATTSSFLTFSMGWAMRLLMRTSPLTEMVATWAISAVVVMMLVWEERNSKKQLILARQSTALKDVRKTGIHKKMTTHTEHQGSRTCLIMQWTTLQP